MSFVRGWGRTGPAGGVHQHAKAQGQADSRSHTSKSCHACCRGRVRVRATRRSPANSLTGIKHEGRVVAAQEAATEGGGEGVQDKWGETCKLPKIAPCHTHFGPGRMDRHGGTIQTQSQSVVGTVLPVVVKLTANSDFSNTPETDEPSVRATQVRCTVGRLPRVIHERALHKCDRMKQKQKKSWQAA
jgi:hypothetical protein